MTWVKLDDQWTDHPKFANVGDLGELVWVKALTYACRFRTGGFVPSGMICKFTRVRNTTTIETSLVKAKLWVKVDDGYQIHDFESYQPNADKTSQARSEAGKAGAAKRWQRDGNCHGFASGKDVAKDISRAGTRAHLPDPVPDPDPKTQSAEPEPASAGTAPKAARLAMNPEAQAVANEIRKHPSLSLIHWEAPEIGNTHSGHMAATGKKLEWALEAIDAFAAKVSGDASAREVKSGLVGFMRTKPKPPPVSGVRPVGGIPIQPGSAPGEWSWKDRQPETKETG